MRPPGGQLLKDPPLHGVVHVSDSGAFAREDPLQRGPEAVSVPGAAHQVRPQLLRRAGVGLGKTAADSQYRLRVLPAEPPDELAVFLVAHRRNGAGVDNIGVQTAGVVRVAQGVPPGGPRLLQCLTLVLIYLAPQGQNGKPHDKYPLHLRQNLI